MGEEITIKANAKQSKTKIDFSKLFSKKSIIPWTIIILILVAMFFSIFFRAYSANLPITENWARQSMENNIRSQISSQINSQYPNLPTAQKSQLIEQEFQTFLVENKDTMNEQVVSSSDYFKSRMQDETGQTYLLAIDPYQHYRLIENIIENGHPGDILKDTVTGKQCLEKSDTCISWNTHKYAPIGAPASTNFHLEFSVFFFRLLHLFNGNITLFAAFFWVPVVLSALCVIPAFFIAKKKIGVFGGFIAALFVAIHPIFISRTAGGFADTDAYVVLFPLLILWTFLEAFEAKTWKKKSILLTVSGFFTGLFSYAWTGWWFSFDIIIIAILLYVWFLLVRKMIGEDKSFSKKILYFVLSVILAPIYIVYLIYVLVINLKDKTKKNEEVFKKVTQTLIVLLIFFALSALFVSLFTSSHTFTNFFTEPFARSAGIDSAVRGEIWPNVFTTVAELNSVSISSIVGQMGGKLLFIIASLGVVLTMLPKEKWGIKSWSFVAFSVFWFLILTTKSVMALGTINYLALFSLPIFVGLFLNLKTDEKIDVKYAILLLLWFIGSMYATTKGTRFTLLLLPAFAVAIGIAVGYIYSIFSRIIWKEMKINEIISKTVVIILLLLLLISPMRSAHSVSQSEVPSMNDAWYESLEGIKDASEPDAIINSWWDFGHWFKAIADRAVTFDGGSQNSPMAHWIGKVLITGDEDEAIGILRMLDCGSNTAFEKLHEYLDKDLEAINVVYELVNEENVGDAKQILIDKGLTNEQADDVLQYTHCDPPEDYFITSQDMVGKAGVWGHFGSWNFKKAAIYTAINGKKQIEAISILQDEFGLSEEEAGDYYFEIQSLASQNEVNAWISPWPSYVTSSMSSCSVVEDVISCNYNKGLGRSNDGSTIILESGEFDVNDLASSKLKIGFYDSSTGAKLGENNAAPREIVFVNENGFKNIQTGSGDFSYTVLLEELEDGTYKSLITDPVFAESTFTKLFYMDGRQTTHFEKFSEKTSVRGEKIIVWKVNWDGE